MHSLSKTQRTVTSHNIQYSASATWTLRLTANGSINRLRKCNYFTSISLRSIVLHSPWRRFKPISPENLSWACPYGLSWFLCGRCSLQNLRYHCLQDHLVMCSCCHSCPWLNRIMIMYTTNSPLLYLYLFIQPCVRLLIVTPHILSAVVCPCIGHL